MHIAVVLQGLDEGGAVASCCLNQVAALAQSHTCWVISDTGLPPGAPHTQLRQVRVPALRWLRRYAHVPRQVLFILKVGARLGFSRPSQPIDLVLFHSHPPTALLAALLRQRLGCRVAMVMHGDIFDRPHGTYDPRLTAWYSLCTSPAYRRADAVLALSPYMAKLAIRGGANPRHVHLVPNGVDAVEIGLDGSAPPPRGQNLLFVGRLEANKGIDLLLQAFRQLAPHHPALQLTCIGSPDVALLAPIQRQLQAEGLHSRVRFLPPQPRHSLGAFYAEAALVVIPSRSETQSTVAMEAMAAGRAVLASNTGGNPMLVDAPSTGLLFRSGDAGDLAAQLGRLISEPESLIAMGHAAAKRHQAEFTRQRNAEQLLKCVQSINTGINSNVVF